MALTLPYSTLSSTSDKNEIEQNFTTVANKFGSITNADISSTAAITVSKLAASSHEIAITFGLRGTELNSASATNWVIGGLPYDSTQGVYAYTIMGIDHAFYWGGVAGARTAQIITLRYGNQTDVPGGSMPTIKAGITVGTTLALGSTLNEVMVTGFTTSVSTRSAGPNYFFATSTQTGVNYAAGDSWVMTIKLKATIRA